MMEFWGICFVIALVVFGIFLGWLSCKISDKRR